MAGTAAETVFWTSLVVVAYVYAGYPLVLLAWSRLASRPVRKGRHEPDVSVVIAARNERETIGGKVHDCLHLDYPPERLEVVISLDGSSDGTDRVVGSLVGEGPGCRVRVVASEHHEGKAAALNRGVEAAGGDVLVFCDARQRLEPGAVRELVASLADPAVGAVTGELLLEDGLGRQAADGVGLYWRYEKALRAMESRIHSTVGATGALYAVRRDLFTPLPAGAILDDVIVPMRAVLAGRRTVFEPRARAHDRVYPPEVEFRRKVRTLAGNFQLVALVPDVLKPWRNPVFVQFVSHKLGRLVVPYLLVALLASNLLLRDGIYLLFLVGQGSWYALAGAGALVSRSARRGAVGASLANGGHRP